mmetsp:Transcript_8395/g.16712  ORF Transcript_8395/g.16712 Transcript_8395/m.16712 type:complete len:1071 (+) Transcript_8395:3154-6366(+)
MEPSSTPSKLAGVFDTGVRVIVNNTQFHDLKGVVRYSGLVSGFTGTMIGVELDKPTEGAHPDANKFFSCRAGTGIFVRATHVKADYDKAKPRPSAATAKESGIKKAREDANEKKKAAEERKIPAHRKALSKQEEEVEQVAEVSVLTEDAPRDRAEDSRQIIAELQKTVTNLTKAKKALEGALEKKDQEIEQLKQTKSKQPRAKVDQSELIETLTMEKEIAESNVEALTKEIEEMKADFQELFDEVTELREEKELRELELEQLRSGDETEIGVEELKLALKKLYTDSQKKAELQEMKIEELENQASIVTELEAQLEQVDKIRDSLVSKEDEINELKDALDEAAGYRDMIESLTEANLKQSEKINELEDNLKEMQELLDIEREISEDAAELERSLNDEIHNKDVEIQQLLRELEGRDEEKVALEKIILQFRTRTSDLNRELNLLREEMKKPGTEQNLGKMQELINANMQYLAKLRDLKAQSIDGQMGNYFAALFRAKADLILSGLPSKLCEDLNLQSYNTVALLRTCKFKAFIVALETTERISDLSQEKKLVNWAYSLATIASNCFAYTGFLEASWRQSSKEGYLEFLRTRNLAQISVAHSYLDSFIKHIKEENIGPALSLDQLALAVEEIRSLSATFRQQSPRVELARELMQALATATTLKKLSYSKEYSDSYAAFLTKSKSLLKNLAFGTEESADFSIAASRLNEKYAPARRQLLGESDSEIVFEAWLADLDLEVKAINAIVRPTELEEAERGPWREIASDVKDKLEQYDKTFEELSNTHQTVKNMSLKFAMMEKEASENKIARSNLEKRLSEAHAKAQMLAQIELEKKRLQERQKHFEDTIEELTSEKEALEDKLKLLEDNITSAGSYRDDAPSRLLFSGNLLVSDSGGMINMARGGNMVESYQDEVTSESVELYKNIIESLQEEKSQLVGSYVLSKLQGLDLKPFEHKASLSGTMRKLKTLQKGLRKRVASVRIVDLKVPKAKQQLQKQQEEFRAYVVEAKKLSAAIVKDASSQNEKFGESLSYHVPVSAENAVEVGEVVLGAGSKNPVAVTLSRLELARLHSLLSLS